MSKSQKDQTPPPGDPWAGYAPFRYDPEGPPLEEERMPLFYMGEKEYTAPRQVSAPTALRCLQTAARHGVARATYDVVIDAIGEEAFNVLTDSKVVPYTEAQEMISQLGKVYFGQSMALAGK